MSKRLCIFPVTAGQRLLNKKQQATWYFQGVLYIFCELWKESLFRLLSVDFFGLNCSIVLSLLLALMGSFSCLLRLNKLLVRSHTTSSWPHIPKQTHMKEKYHCPPWKDTRAQLPDCAFSFACLSSRFNLMWPYLAIALIWILLSFLLDFRYSLGLIMLYTQGLAPCNPLDKNWNKGSCLWTSFLEIFKSLDMFLGTLLWIALF